jgi:signal transduction histidine kinase
VDWLIDHHPPRRDALAALAFAGVWFGGIWFARHHGWYPHHLQTYYWAGSFTVGVLLSRASFPRATLLAAASVYPLYYDGFRLENEFHLLPILLAAYTATESSRMSTAWALAAAEFGIVGLYLQMAARGGVDVPHYLGVSIWSWDLSGLSVALVGAAGVVLLGRASLQQRRTTVQLLDRHRELERLRRLETDQVVSAERTRIARELHDVVAHHISAVVIRAQAADRVADDKPEETRAAVRWIAANGQETLAAMRYVVRVLRSTEQGGSLTPQATLAELPEIAARMGAVGLPVELRLPAATPVLPAAVELAMVRIVQEALTNVLVHAQASRAMVELRVTDDEFRIDVHDDGTASGPPTVPLRLFTGAKGRPLTPQAGAGLGIGLGGNGLIGMRERAAACGGALSIGTSPLGGWLVTAVLRAAAL